MNYIRKNRHLGLWDKDLNNAVTGAVNGVGNFLGGIFRKHWN